MMNSLLVLSLVTAATTSGGSPPVTPSVQVLPSLGPTPLSDSTLSSARLTVRPREMATGTKTSAAGFTELPGLDGYYLYVPEKCVGDKRSPMVVLLHGGGRNGQIEAKKFRELADEFGIVMLTGNASKPGRWDVIAGIMDQSTKTKPEDGMHRVMAYSSQDVPRIDSAMKYVLHNYAIDPARIALLGFSDGGSYSLFLGLSNLDVFSRVAPLSALIPFKGVGPEQAATQLFLSGGVGEGKMVAQTLMVGALLRKQGHAVRTQIGLRGHVDHVEDERFVWEWLLQSWADPKVTTQLPKESEDPLLTEDVVKQVTTFWTQFMQQPDSIVKVERMKNQIQRQLTVGSEPTTVVMTDFVAFAKKFPAIATLLKENGLTAEQFMAYRTAIVRAAVAYMAAMPIAGASTSTPQEGQTPFVAIAPESALGKNVVFWKENKGLMQELAATRFLSIQ